MLAGRIATLAVNIGAPCSYGCDRGKSGVNVLICATAGIGQSRGGRPPAKRASYLVGQRHPIRASALPASVHCAQSHVDAWLNPEPVNLPAQHVILDNDRARLVLQPMLVVPCCCSSMRRSHNTRLTTVVKG